MNAMNIGDFLAMGGYAFYVWGSYLVAGALLAIEAVSVRARLRAAREAAAGGAR
jgi:heme exporter protein D